MGYCLTKLVILDEVPEKEDILQSLEKYTITTLIDLHVESIWVWPAQRI